MIVGGHVSDHLATSENTLEHQQFICRFQQAWTNFLVDMKAAIDGDFGECFNIRAT